MTDDSPSRPRAVVPRGFRDVFAAEAEARRAMLDVIRGVYHGYGFEPLESSAIEYVEALGKFLPDVDRPMGGVFGFRDDDDQWLALRYDLTAPLARVVAGNFAELPKPYRRYAVGSVWRNEKPGPGRFREFTQFDADTVGTPVMAADAEITMLLADAMEALGVGRGDYLVRVNNRKVLSGVLEVIGLGGDDPAIAETRLTALRAIDKLDRFGVDGVRLLLGPGRRDESGDFTRGAGLSSDQIDVVTGFVAAGEGADCAAAVCARLDALVAGSEVGREGVSELAQIAELAEAGGYGGDRIRIDPGVVRGLAYYTGPVFEAELTFETVNEKGEPARFGSVAGGGRYDDLVKRFTGQSAPATGVSIGVDRLLSALRFLGKTAEDAAAGPVVVLVLDRDRIADYQAMTQELRRAGVRAEMYLGGSGMRAQMKYADRRRAPAVVIQGSNERDAGEVTVKDLVLGAKLAQSIDSNEEWRAARPAQQTVARGALVATVRALLANGEGAA